MAASQAVEVDAGSRIGVDSVTGVAVRDGRGVEEGASTSVAVDEGKEVADADSIVSVGAKIGRSVAVSAGDIDEVVTMIGCA